MNLGERARLIHGLTESRISDSALVGAVNQSIYGERPFFNEWMGRLERSVQGVNGLIDEMRADPSTLDPDLVAIQAIPGLLPHNPTGKLPSIQCENIEETEEWVLSLPDTFDTLNREIERGHYTRPIKIIELQQNPADLSTVFGFYVYDLYARAVVTRYEGTKDKHENLKSLRRSKKRINELLKPERDAADVVVNALCEEAVVAAERAIANGEPSDKIALVGFFDKLDWYKPIYGFTSGLIAREKAIAAFVNPNESAQIFRGLLS